MAAQFRAAIDGGSRGNPGLAAWGVAILDTHGELAEGHAGVLAHATNNVAEYHGLLAALRLALGQGAEEVEIQADSQLVVRQVLGEYRVRHEGLKPLYRQAMQQIRRLRSFRIRHVRREENKQADRLVNKALDEAEASPDPGTVVVHETPGVGDR